jgi:hypothetical protein
MSWYWYITGFVTAVTLASVAINLMVISGWAKVTLNRPARQRMHVIYDWSDDSGPINRVG